MYLHLGRDTVILDKILVGVFDLDTCSVSKHTRAFLREAERRSQETYVTQDIPKSFVVTEEYGQSGVLLTQIAASTIAKRLGRTIQ
jgi:hypothetical protein